MKKNNIILFITAGLFFAMGCSHSSPDDLSEAIVPLDKDKAVAYTSDVKPIVDAACVKCHSGNGPANFLPLTTSDEVKNAIQNNGLLTRINDAANPMPPSGLMAQNKRDLIQKWKEGNFTK